MYCPATVALVAVRPALSWLAQRQAIGRVSSVS